MPLNGFWMAAAAAIASRPSNPNRAAPPRPYAKRPKNSRRLIPKLICEHDMAISHHNSPEKCVVSRGTGGRNPKPEIRNPKQARIAKFEKNDSCGFLSFGFFAIRVSIFEFLPHSFGFTSDARALLSKSPRQFDATRVDSARYSPNIGTRFLYEKVDHFVPRE